MTRFIPGESAQRVRVGGSADAVPCLGAGSGRGEDPEPGTQRPPIETRIKRRAYQRAQATGSNGGDPARFASRRRVASAGSRGRKVSGLRLLGPQAHADQFQCGLDQVRRNMLALPVQAVSQACQPPNIGVEGPVALSSCRPASARGLR